MGVIIVPFGLFMRNSLTETLDVADEGAQVPVAAAAAQALRARIGPYVPIIIYVLVLFSCGAIGSYVLDYMTTYALNTLHLPANVAFGVTVVTATTLIFFRPISGLLSDHYGRKRIIITGYALMLVLVLPSFWIINRYPSAMIVYFMMGLIAILFGIAIPPIIVALTEALPKTIRSGVVATAYAFAISVFGGSTQFVITWLIRRTGDPLAPAWYWMGAILLGLIAASLMPETAPVKLNASRADPPASPQAAAA
jgi:MFS family permease